MHLENLQINNIDRTESLITHLNWSLMSLPKCEIGQNLNELKSSGVSSTSSDSRFDLPELKHNLLTVVSSSLSNNIHLTTPN